SGGLHGVGISVVNALSAWLEAEGRRDGKVYFQRYERGKPQTEVKVIGEAATTGTKITFKPDHEIFDNCEFDLDTLGQRLRELAFLTRGLKINIKDERVGKELSFHYEGGIVSFVQALNRTKTPLFDDVIYIQKEAEGSLVEVALQYNDGFVENVYTFANNINTVEG